MKIGTVSSLFPGHRAVFRGEYTEWGDPVFETELPPVPKDTPFMTLMKKLEKK